MEYYIDSDNQMVHVLDPELTDPNGEPLFVTYTLEEWNSLELE